MLKVNYINSQAVDVSEMIDKAKKELPYTFEGKLLEQIL